MKNKKFIATISAIIVAMSAMSFTAFAATEEPASEEGLSISTTGTSIVNDDTEEVEDSDSPDKWNGGDTVDDTDMTTMQSPDKSGFQYYGDGLFSLYEADKAVPDLCGTAGGATAFLLQMNKSLIEENKGYSITLSATAKSGKEFEYTFTSDELPNYGIEPDEMLTGYAGGYDKESIVVLPINVREAFEKLGAPIDDIETFTITEVNGAIEYIAIGTWASAAADEIVKKPDTADTKTAPDTGIEGVAVIAGLAILAGGTALVAGRKRK